MLVAADETGMWVIESTMANKENTGQIIESAAHTIMDRLTKEKLIDRKHGGSST